MIHNTCSLSTCLERLLREDACPATRFLLLQCGCSCCRGLNACRMSPRRRKKVLFSAVWGHASIKHLVGTMRHVDQYKIDRDTWNSLKRRYFWVIYLFWGTLLPLFPHSRVCLYLRWRDHWARKEEPRLNGVFRNSNWGFAQLAPNAAQKSAGMYFQ